MERTQFTFYESFFKAISRIKKDADRCKAYDAICSYALYGNEPDLSGEAKKAFDSILDGLDTEIRESREGRRSTRYKDWRKQVFDRDDYTCQRCGVRGAKMNAHHKLSYANYHDLRYDISNGITLCVPCHKAVHRGC